MQLTRLAAILSFLLACHAAPVPEGQAAKTPDPLSGSLSPSLIGDIFGKNGAGFIPELGGGNLNGGIIPDAPQARALAATPKALQNLPEKAKKCLMALAALRAGGVKVTRADVQDCLNLKD